MRYIVCGLHRTGTSALMRAVIASSTLTPYVDLSMEQIIRSREVDPNYDPNPDGYFAHRFPLSLLDEWITDTPDDSVMKAGPEAFAAGTGPVPVNVIVTNRNSAEIESSFMRAFGHSVPAYRWAARAALDGILAADPNVTVTSVDFADLISDPTGTFTRIAAAGWPIDVATAAATIDPSLYRNF